MLAFRDEALEPGARLRDRVRPRDADRVEALRAGLRNKLVLQKSRFA
jgi:hypothetical protein